MNPLALLGAFACSIIILQLYYIWSYYAEIEAYVNQYKMFRYGIDIVPNYIDPSTSDYNDTITIDITSKRRCVKYQSNYVIINSSGYAIATATDNSVERLTYDTLLECVVDMTENDYIFDGICQISPRSVDCTLLQLMLNSPS